MDVKVDSVGRILVPKELRDKLGITPGSTVDISWHGAGLTIVPGGRSQAPLVERDGRLVIGGSTPITDEDVFRLIDEGRR